MDFPAIIQSPTKLPQVTKHCQVLRFETLVNRINFSQHLAFMLTISD